MPECRSAPHLLSSAAGFEAVKRSGERSSSFDTILKVVTALGLKLSASVRSEAEVTCALKMRRRSENDACGDATPSNKPLEWTVHLEFTSGNRYSLPATQGQRSKDVSCSMGTRKAALRHRSQEATVGAWLKSARQSGSSDGLQVCVI